MEIVIFIFYLFLFIFFISIFPFFKNIGIALWKIVALFVIKILAGIAYALFYTLPKYVAGADTWRFYKLSLQETDWLKREPLAFIKDLFSYGYGTSGNLFSGENSYWNDLKSNVIIKLMALMNVFSLNGYYTNIILFNFIFLFGLVGLLKVFIPIYPDKKHLLIVTVFLLPSTLFWCSGIHKDGLILSAIGLVVYSFHKSITARFSLKQLIAIVLLLVLIFSLRNYVAFALIPALLAWYLSEKDRSNKTTIFFVIYLTGILAFFIIPLLAPSINFPLFLAHKQNEFLQLEGSSQITYKQLEPTIVGFLSYLPTALDVAFFRPHPTEIKSISFLPAIAEVIFLWVLVALAIFFMDRKSPLLPITLFFLFFSVSIMLISGFTITFSGAIVRYRSFVLPLFITPLICTLDLNRLKQVIGININKELKSGK